MKKICLSLVLLSMSFLTIAQVKVQNLMVESRVNPLGVDAKTPKVFVAIHE